MKKISRRFSEALGQAKRSPVYVVERVKLLFSVSLERRRKAAGLSYSELANRMETSPAYITKVFRGDSNLTIETMVKLALATGSELDIRLVEAGTARASWDTSKLSGTTLRAPSVTANAVVTMAANHHSFFIDPQLAAA